MMDKPAVCIATIRPEQFKEWLAAWKDEFEREEVQIFAMADNMMGEEIEDVLLRNTTTKVGRNCFDHDVVRDELKDKSWIIPKKTSACKSFAIYKAWKAGCDPIMVLDDDCLPQDPWVKRHTEVLNSKTQNDVYLTIVGIRPRGVPFIKAKPLVLSHGLWSENLDVDAVTELAAPPISKVRDNQGVIPLGCLFPMSGMNVAFRREIAPLMYFGLQGPTWGVDRFDDIWCGFLAKKVLDHCGYAVWSGTPYVRHVKASDPFVNIVKEAPGYKMNVELYEMIMAIPIDLEKRELEKSMAFIADGLITWQEKGYWGSYGKAIIEWLELFKPEEAFGI